MPSVYLKCFQARYPLHYYPIFQYSSLFSHLLINPTYLVIWVLAVLSFSGELSLTTVATFSSGENSLCSGLTLCLLLSGNLDPTDPPWEWESLCQNGEQYHKVNHQSNSWILLVWQLALPKKAFSALSSSHLSSHSNDEGLLHRSRGKQEKKLAGWKEAGVGGPWGYLAIPSRKDPVSRKQHLRKFLGSSQQNVCLNQDLKCHTLNTHVHAEFLRGAVFYLSQPFPICLFQANLWSVLPQQ